MKFSVFDLLMLITIANAHAIFQRISVNGADKGYLTGVRAPSSNSPLEDVTSPNIACNTGIHSPVSNAIVSIAPGDKIGALWQHVLGGPQGANDPENPIASTHKGPIIYYMAKVPNAASSGTAGLKWFKVAQDTLTTSNGQWGVDRMIANKGWSYFTLPSCVAPGNYLLRVEIIALHQAQPVGGAQFYTSCGQVKVTGSGTANPATVSFPGAYKATDPGIKINIYGSNGQPTNGGKPYTAPGPAVLSCGAGGKGKQPTATKPQKPQGGGSGSPGGGTKGGAGGSPGGSSGSPGGSGGGSNGGSPSRPTPSDTCSTSAMGGSYPIATPSGGSPYPISSAAGGSNGYPTAVSQANTGKVALYGQCAGQKWTGPTVCAVGSCQYQNPYYSQCLE